MERHLKVDIPRDGPSFPLFLDRTKIKNVGFCGGGKTGGPGVKPLEQGQ